MHLMVLKFQAATSCFSCSSPDLNSIELSPSAVKVTKVFLYKLNNSTLIQKIKIPHPCLELVSNHSAVFIFTLPLSQGQAGEAWEPSNETTFFLSPHKPLPWHSLSSYSFSLRSFKFQKGYTASSIRHRSWESFSCSKNSRPFIEPEGSLPCSQQHDIGSNPQSDESSLHCDIQYF
jgi:hypothetical protein